MLKLVLLNECNFKKRCMFNNQKKKCWYTKILQLIILEQKIVLSCFIETYPVSSKGFLQAKNNDKIGKCSSNCKIHIGWGESVTAQRRIWLARADFITNGATPSYYHSVLPGMFYKQCFSLNKIMFSWSFSRLFECPQRPKQLQPGQWPFHRIA